MFSSILVDISSKVELKLDLFMPKFLTLAFSFPRLSAEVGESRGSEDDKVGGGIMIGGGGKGIVGKDDVEGGDVEVRGWNVGLITARCGFRLIGTCGLLTFRGGTVAAELVCIGIVDVEGGVFGVVGGVGIVVCTDDIVDEVELDGDRDVGVLGIGSIGSGLTLAMSGDGDAGSEGSGGVGVERWGGGGGAFLSTRPRSCKI